MRPQHHIYTSGLGYLLNSVLLETIVCVSRIYDVVLGALTFVKHL